MSSFTPAAALPVPRFYTTNLFAKIKSNASSVDVIPGPAPIARPCAPASAPCPSAATASIPEANKLNVIAVSPLKNVRGHTVQDLTFITNTQYSLGTLISSSPFKSYLVRPAWAGGGNKRKTKTKTKKIRNMKGGVDIVPQLRYLGNPYLFTTSSFNWPDTGATIYFDYYMYLTSQFNYRTVAPNNYTLSPSYLPTTVNNKIWGIENIISCAFILDIYGIPYYILRSKNISIVNSGTYTINKRPITENYNQTRIIPGKYISIDIFGNQNVLTPPTRNDDPSQQRGDDATLDHYNPYNKSWNQMSPFDIKFTPVPDIMNIPNKTLAISIPANFNGQISYSYINSPPTMVDILGNPQPAPAPAPYTPAPYTPAPAPSTPAPPR